jgi:hypothetical protein
MNKTLTLALAGAALLALGSASSAQEDVEWQYFVTGSGADRMVMSRSGGEGAALLIGENGARPGDCPAGSFYEGANGVIHACDDDAQTFGLVEPESGMMMDSGQPFEQGAMLLRPQDPTGSGADSSSDEAEATGSIGGEEPGGGGDAGGGTDSGGNN